MVNVSVLLSLRSGQRVSSLTAVAQTASVMLLSDGIDGLIQDHEPFQGVLVAILAAHAQSPRPPTGFRKVPRARLVFHAVQDVPNATLRCVPDVQTASTTILPVGVIASLTSSKTACIVLLNNL